MEKIILDSERATFLSGEQYGFLAKNFCGTEKDFEEFLENEIKEIKIRFPSDIWKESNDWANEVLNRYLLFCLKKEIVICSEAEKSKRDGIINGIFNNVKNEAFRKSIYDEKEWTRFELGRKTSNPESVSKQFTLYRKISVESNHPEVKTAEIVQKIYFTDITKLRITLDPSNPVPWTLNLGLYSTPPNYQKGESVSTAYIVWSRPDCNFQIISDKNYRNGVKKMNELDVNKTASEFGDSLVLTIGNHPSNGMETVIGEAVVKLKKPFREIFIEEEDEFESDKPSPQKELEENETIPQYDVEDTNSARQYFNDLGFNENETDYLIDKVHNKFTDAELKSKYQNINSTRLKEKFIPSFLYSEDSQTPKSKEEIRQVVKTKFGIKYAEGSRLDKIYKGFMKLFRKNQSLW